MGQEMFKVGAEEVEHAAVVGKEAVCSECGAAVSERRIPRAVHWTHWRRLVPMVTLLLSIAAVGLMSAISADADSNVHDDRHGYSFSFIDPPVTYSDLVAKATGKSTSTELSDRFPDVDLLNHETARGRIRAVGIRVATREGILQQTWERGWPEPWITLEKIRPVRDVFADVDRAEEQYWASIEDAMGRDPKIESGFDFWFWPTIRYERFKLVSAFFWINTWSFDLGQLSLVLVLTVVASRLVYWILHAVSGWASAALAGRGSRQRGKRIRRYSVSIVSLGAVFVAVSLSLLKFDEESIRYPGGFVIDGNNVADFEFSREVLLGLAQSSDREYRIALDILSRLDRRPSDDEVIAIAWDEEFNARSESKWTSIGWPARFFDIREVREERIFPDGRAEPFEPAGEYPEFSLYESAVSVRQKDKDDPARIRSYEIALDNLAFNIFCLWLVWSPMRFVCWLIAWRVTRRRVKRQRCVVCGYQLPLRDPVRIGEDNSLA